MKFCQSKFNDVCLIRLNQTRYANRQEKTLKYNYRKNILFPNRRKCSLLPSPAYD